MVNECPGCTSWPADTGTLPVSNPVSKIKIKKLLVPVTGTLISRSVRLASIALANAFEIFLMATFSSFTAVFLAELCMWGSKDLGQRHVRPTHIRPGPCAHRQHMLAV